MGSASVLAESKRLCKPHGGPGGHFFAVFEGAASLVFPQIVIGRNGRLWFRPAIGFGEIAAGSFFVLTERQRYPCIQENIQKTPGARKVFTESERIEKI